MNGKRSIGWHIAGMILAIVLLIVSVTMLFLGIYAFDTADYPMIDNKGLFAVESTEIIPQGAAIVADADMVPERGVPVVYMDAEQERICVQYYYGEEDGRIILADRNSENVIEIEPYQLRGCAVSTVRYLGRVLNGACSLAGVCISLSVSLLLCFAIVLILIAAIRVNRRNREDAVQKDEIYDEEAPLEEVLQEERPAQRIEINMHLSMEILPKDAEDRVTVLFFGSVSNILKLAQIIRTAAEKKGIDSIVVEERYDETCGLCVIMEEKDLPLIHSIAAVLKDWRERPLSEQMPAPEKIAEELVIEEAPAEEKAELE